MSTTDGSNGTGGGGAPGPGGGSGAGPGGGSSATTPTGEPLKIIKTQLIPHPHPASLQLQSHSPLPSPTTSTPTLTPSSNSSTTTISNNNPQIAHVHAPIQLKNPTNVTNLFSLNPVAAKITHVKTTTLEAANAAGGLTLSGLSQAQGGGGGSGATGTIVTSGGLSTVGTIKVGNSGAVATSISGNPQLSLNTSQSNNSSGATSIRAIGAGGQSTQVRVVMGNIMTQSMIKQLENAGPGRTQITAFPTAPARSVSNTSITVTRTATQATYLPRASVTATQMTGVNVGVPGGQRLVTPIRTTPASVTATGTGGATVTGITATGNFVRGTAVSRNTSSPATTVISPATSTTWMAANPTGQVQLIRAIPHQSRQRIITTQGIGGSPVSASGSVTGVSGTVVTSTSSAMQSVGGVTGQQQQQTSNTQQMQGQQSTIQTVSSVATQQQQQQTYVATVLPPRQHQATLVYSSNVATSQPLSQPQQFNPTSVAATGPRFAVATPLTGATGTVGAARQIRPIPFAKSFSTAKLNTTSISIRAPNLPQLTPTLGTGVSNASVGSNASNSPRSTAITGVTSTANVLPSTNLSATRIIQLQQQPGGTAQQIIGPTGRLAANVMLQPIIVNTSGAGKIGLRPPVTMAAKVQPSLTITQLGIGKLPSSSTGSPSLGQQNLAGINTSTGSNSPSISTASITATNLSNNATAQLVNVSQGGANSHLLTTQNLVTSQAGTAAGGATVVPLAISNRGAGGGNIITGTMTPIKNASAITVGKVMTQAQLSSPLENINNTNSNNNNSGPTNVFIHHAPAPQRPHSNSSTSSLTGGSINNSSAGVNVSNTGATNVLTSTGSVATGTFLQPGSTIYYESVPASSVQVSTGVLSLTTTTVTSSTMSQNQMASSAGNLSISSLPFVSHSNSGNPTTATFTVVPSTGGRTIGQLQIPVSSAGTQIQAVPVRFSQLNAGNLATAAADAIAVSQAQPQILQQQQQQQNSSSTQETSQILIPASMGQQNNTANSMNQQQQQQQHQQTHQMVIPLQTSIKVTSGAGSAGTTVVSNFLRKRDVEGSPIRAAKNLQPTLLSMGSSAIMSNSSPASSSVASSYSLTSVTSSASSNVLTAEALAKKDRTQNNLSSSNLTSNTPQQLASTRTSRADSPASSDGSTTVSANSSPGVDQQIQDNNMIINRLPGGGGGSGGGSVVGPNVDSHFNPINELYSNHHSVVSQQHNITGTPVTTRNLASMDHHNLHAAGGSNNSITIQQRLNGGAIDCPPRKKSRRSTNDSQLSQQSQTSLILPPPQANNVSSAVPTATSLPHEINLSSSSVMANGTVATAAAGHEVVNGKENAKPVEFILKRPKNCTLMSTYKQSWKSAYNHFQRYSDVKPRDDRKPPTIMDLANQTNVLGKINGWKIYHLKSQMEDLCENESLGYEKLSSMLKHMESNGITNEIERISDLLKGNMQRSKIIVDGVSEAQNQIMKIFEHKTHVSDIINRCASKRNYKKREKV